jgi:hypothetical protein
MDSWLKSEDLLVPHHEGLDDFISFIEPDDFLEFVHTILHCEAIDGEYESLRFGADPGDYPNCIIDPDGEVLYSNWFLEIYLLISFETLVYYLKVAAQRFLLEYPQRREYLESIFRSVGKPLEN